MAFNKKKIPIFITYLIFVFASCLISFNLSWSPTVSLKYLGLICTIQLLAFYCVSKWLCGRFLNFGTVFATVLFVFNFGQLIINTFFTSIYSHVRFLLLLSPEDALYGFKWINLSFNIICLGISLAESLMGRENLENAKYKKLNYTEIAKRIICFTFPMKIIVDLICVYICLSSGGVAARTWLNNSPNVFLYYGKISLVGFGLLIISLKEFPSRQKRVFVFIEVYILLMMVSGIRSENVGYVVILLLVYFSSRKNKISLPLCLLYCFLSVFVLAFIIAVGNFRLVEDKSLGSFFETFKQALTEKNVILSLLDTCGDTGYTALCVITKWLPQYSPSYGASYIGGIFAILPNIPKIFTLPGDITEATAFALKLQEYGTLSADYKNIGGSLIGELFFNFGLIGGAIFSIFVGLLVGGVNKKFLVGLHDKPFELICALPFMFAMIYWVRSYFGGGTREVVWDWLFTYLVFKHSKAHNVDWKRSGVRQL